MRKTLLAAAALLTLGTAASAEDYYFGPDKNGCVAPPEGWIGIENGSFTLGETTYERVGAQQRDPDGFVHAIYEAYAEGEAYGTTGVALRFSEGKVEIILKESAEKITGKLCP